MPDLNLDEKRNKNGGSCTPICLFSILRLPQTPPSPFQVSSFFLNLGYDNFPFYLTPSMNFKLNNSVFLE